jgi:DNA-binding response OmpR family regulator
MKIIVVEDDRKLSSLLQRALTEEGYVVDCCASAEDALIQGRSGLYDLMILDRMIPGMDGLEVCRRLRQRGSTLPIIILTARGEVEERVLGLTVGADAYLVKPFQLTELLAYVNALLRRSSGQKVLKLGSLEIDRSDRTARIGGKALDLTTREFNLLLHLALRADQLVTRGELLANVWSMQFSPGTNIIEVYINRLRAKLGPYADQIQTVRGRGYILHTDPTNRAPDHDE